METKRRDVPGKEHLSREELLLYRIEHWDKLLSDDELIDWLGSETESEIESLVRDEGYDPTYVELARSLRAAAPDARRDLVQAWRRREKASRDVEPRPSGATEAVFAERSALDELTNVVGRTLKSEDGAALRAFIQKRRAANGRLLDSKRGALDVEKLEKALREIESVEGSTVGREPETLALLTLARGTPTRARDVSALAFEKLVDSAGRLAKLIRVGAPDIILTAEVETTSRALGALDGFDYYERCVRHFGEDDLGGDEELVDLALRATSLAEYEDHGVAHGVDLPFVEGRELFPRPEDPVLARAWERFLSPSVFVRRPRVAQGEELVAAVGRLSEHLARLLRDLPAMSETERKRAKAVDRYRGWLDVAVKREFLVVEWVTPAAVD